MRLPWWVLLYLVIYAGIGIAAAVDDCRRSERLSWAFGELLATALGSLLVVALWQESLRLTLGKAVLPLFAGVLLWEIVAAVHDLKNVEPDPELSAASNIAANRLGVALATLMVAPAIAAGAVLSWRVIASTV